MVSNDEASRHVWLDRSNGALAGAKVGAIAIESSTLTPAWVHELGSVTSKVGVTLLDAMVSGSTPQAEQREIFARWKSTSVSGIWSDEQMEGWRLLTDAVHKEGGRMCLQLWHVGRISDPIYLHGKLPVAPSALAPEGQVNLLRLCCTQGIRT